LMASALTLGMPSDESHLMEAVSRRVRFDWCRWNALESNTANIDEPELARPGQRQGMGGGPKGDIALARARGAGVLLTGDLGDAVMFAWGLRRDAVRHLQLRSLLGQTLGYHPVVLGGRLLLKASLGVLPPRIALELAERISSRPRKPPPWMGPRLRAIYPPRREDLDVPDRAWSSHLQCELWARLTSPHVAATLEFPVQSGAAHGIEVRLPYSDVRFIESVLAIPASQRLARPSVWSLRQDALGPWMPSEFQSRRSQPSWMPVFAQAARSALPRVGELLSDGTWLSGPFITKEDAQTWLADLTRQGAWSPANDCVLLAEFGALEAWLRLLLRYDSAREVEE
jgi:hypothetical protein